MVHHHKPECHANKTTGLPSSRTRSQGSCNQSITVSIFKTSYPFATKLCLMIYWEYLVKNCFAVFKVNVIAKAQNSNECLSGWYFLNYLTFCSQTWCGDASSRTRVFFKRAVLLHSSSKSLWGLPCQIRSSNILTAETLKKKCIYALSDEDEDDNWWCYGGPFWFETTWQGRRPWLLSYLSRG